MPICALSLLGGGGAFAMDPSGKKPSPEEAEHKFDKEFDKPLTYSTLFRVQYSEFMQLAAAVQKEWGQDKFIEFLKNTTTQRMLQYGKAQAKQKGKDDFQSYVAGFRGPQYDKSLTMKIVEDTDTVFELKVTECLWAKTFLDAKLGDIGYAHICFGDYAWAQGYNSKIRMVRDKTLMQGHDYCNHRYLWEG